MGIMFAVVEIGGKQYCVAPQDKIKVEKLDVKEGETVSFDHVLLVNDKSDVAIGKPYVDGAKVTARIVGHGRDAKKIVFKYHNKTRFRKKKGHRQHFTELEITEIK
ncbi:MAG: 50S ribosomal protein L21 [bacterium]